MTPQQLAQELVLHAHQLRSVLLHRPDSLKTDCWIAIQERFGCGTEEAFTSNYAQTVVYGLFSLRWLAGQEPLRVEVLEDKLAVSTISSATKT